jgi:hypothetical protein
VVLLWLRFFSSPNDWGISAASGLGFVRLCMGLPCAFVSFFIAMIFISELGFWSNYIVLIPLRYTEWLIMSS